MRTLPSAPSKLGGCSVRLVLAVAVAAVSAGCSLLPGAKPVDPSVNFVAHPGWRGLVVDRMANGQKAVLVGADSVSPSAGPSQVLQANGKTLAALWVSDHDRITVRQTPDGAAPVVGDVLASWEQGIMRVAFRSAEGASFRTSRFKRVDREDTPEALDSEMLAVSRDLPGVYRAEVRDAQNSPVGWLSVRILPYQGLPRDYEGDVPAVLNGPLATAAVVLVDKAIDSIVERNVFPEDRMPEGLVP
jgi:hypothetical protein